MLHQSPCITADRNPSSYCSKSKRKSLASDYQAWLYPDNSHRIKALDSPGLPSLCWLHFEAPCSWPPSLASTVVLLDITIRVSPSSLHHTVWERKKCPPLPAVHPAPWAWFSSFWWHHLPILSQWPWPAREVRYVGLLKTIRIYPGPEGSIAPKEIQIL